MGAKTTTRPRAAPVIKTPRLTKSEVLRRRVEAGAAYLDVYYPGWEHRIDVKTLMLSSYDKCVLGQLYDGYGAGTSVLCIEDEVAIYGNGELGQHKGLGFNANTEREYGQLTKLWRAKILSLRRKRRNK